MTDPFALVLVFIATLLMVGGAIVGGIIMAVRASNSSGQPRHDSYVDNASLQSRGTPSAGAKLWADVDHHASTSEHHDIAS